MCSEVKSVICLLKRLDFERPRFGMVRFSHDGKAVVYPTRDKGVDNLWLQPLDGFKGKQITDFTAVVSTDSGQANSRVAKATNLPSGERSKTPDIARSVTV